MGYGSLVTHLQSDSRVGAGQGDCESGGEREGGENSVLLLKKRRAMRR